MDGWLTYFEGLSMLNSAMNLTIRLPQARGVIEGNDVYDATQTAYNIANVLDGHVSNAPMPRRR